MKKKNYTISIEENIIEQVKKIAENKDRTLSSQITRFIKQGVDNYNKQTFSINENESEIINKSDTENEVKTIDEQVNKYHDYMHTKEIINKFVLNLTENELRGVLSRAGVPSKLISNKGKCFNIKGFDLMQIIEDAKKSDE